MTHLKYLGKTCQDVQTETGITPLRPPWISHYLSLCMDFLPDAIKVAIIAIAKH